MSDVIKFPARAPSTPAGIAESPAEPITDAEFEKVHSVAFRDLGPLICDCVSMAKIAADAVMSIRTEDREAVFAVAHAYEMLAALKKDYLPCGAAQNGRYRSMRKRNRQPAGVSH